MRETKYNKLHGHKLRVALRREQLIAMIMTEPDRKWSVRDMANEAQKLEWFKKNHPDYSKSTAAKDYIQVIDDIKDRREELADHYIRSHLVITEDLLDNLKEQLNDLEADYDFLTGMIEADDVEPKDALSISKQRSKLRKEMRDINNNMLAVMRRQSTLVPIQVPFEQTGNGVVVNNIQLSIDDFQKQKAMLSESLQKRIESPVIEGEYTDG